MAADRIAWEEVPCLFVPRQRCPECGTTRTPIPIRSEANLDGSVTRKRICRECGQPFKLVIEDPD